MSASINFADGITIMRKYFTPKTKAMVCESSSFCVERALPFEEEDLNKLRELGWDAHVSDDKKSGIAYYHKLDYADY